MNDTPKNVREIRQRVFADVLSLPSGEQEMAHWTRYHRDQINGLLRLTGADVRAVAVRVVRIPNERRLLSDPEVLFCIDFEDSVGRRLDAAGVDAMIARVRNEREFGARMAEYLHR